MLSFIIKEFIDEIEKRFIIVEVEVLIEDEEELDSLVIERIYESIDNLHLCHEARENSSLKEKEELYIQQEKLFYEIVEKQEEYHRYKHAIERAKEMSTNEEKLHFLKLLDINNTWEGDQSSWNSIKKHFTTN